MIKESQPAMEMTPRRRKASRGNSTLNSAIFHHQITFNNGRESHKTPINIQTNKGKRYLPSFAIQSISTCHNVPQRSTVQRQKHTSPLLNHGRYTYLTLRLESNLKVWPNSPVWPNSFSVTWWDAEKKLHVRGARCRKN